MITGTRLRTPARASVWYFALGAITKCVGLTMTPVFTRLLSGEEYGAYSYYMSLVGFGGIIASTLLSSGISYGGFEKFGEERFFGTAMRSSLVIALFAGVLVSLFSGVGASLGALLVLQLLSDAALGIYLMRERYGYRYRTVVSLSLLTAIFAPALSFILIYFFALGYRGRIYALLLVSLPAAAFLVFRALKNSTAGKSEAEYIRKNALPQLPLAGANALSAEADKLIVGRMLGSTALAKYAVAYSLGAGLSFAVGAVCSALCPWTLRKLRVGDAQIVRRVTGLVILILASLSLILTSLAPEAISFLAPSSYGRAVYAVLPIALSAIPSFGTAVLTLTLTHGGLSGKAARLCASGTLVGTLACLILVPSLGYLGAGISVLLSSVLNFGLLLFGSGRAGLTSVISGKRIFLSLALALAWAIFTSLLYDYALARLLLMLPPALVGLGALFECRKYVFEEKTA